MSERQSKVLNQILYQRSMRPKIAYLLNSFPTVSETFILQEILELERQGLSLHLFSLSEPHSSKLAGVVWDGQAPVTYISRYSRLSLLMTAAGRFFKAPWRFLSASIVIVARYRQRSVLGYLLYATYLAGQLEREGITHLHA